MRSDPTERARLRRWCGLLAIAATIFAFTNVATRHRERLAVTLLVVGLLAVALTTTVTHPDLESTTALAVLLAGVVALLFADRHMLPRLLVLTWAVGLIATLATLLPAAPVVRPAAFETFMSVTSVSAALALILWLLWQARGRAQALLFDVLRQERRIQSMVDSALDAIAVVGSDGVIRSWNPRAADVFGWSAAEAVGVNLGDLLVPERGRDSYDQTFRDATAALDGARPLRLRREVTARHRDGHEVPIEISVSRFDSDGEILLSAFMRDLSEQRATEAQLDREIRERSAVARSVARVRPGATAEQTAASICRHISESLNVDVAAIYHLISSTQAVALGLRAPRGAPVSRAKPLPPGRAAYLIRRARSGPWIDRWQARPEDGAYGQSWSEMGLEDVAYVPFRGSQGLLGLVVVAKTGTSSGPDDMAHRMPSLVEFAALAGALLGPQLTGRRDRQAKRDQISAVIEKQAFHPVFQPILDVDTGEVVGYEALTRFHDLVRPDVRLAEAEAAGLGLELETAMMAAALEAADQLPEGPWISLNASPRMVLNGDRLSGMLRNVPRTMVIEITEQSPITDYVAVRKAVADIGDHVRLAVDDAGAGFASLRHIIELRPNLVKLDVELIRGIHADSARQALVAGMVHFAQRAGCELIAAFSLPAHAPFAARPPVPPGVWNWSPIEPVDLRGVPIKH